VVGISLTAASALQQLNAQHNRQGVSCRAPTADVDTIIRRIELVAAGMTQLGRSTHAVAMYDAVATPFWSEPCARLRNDVDRAAATTQVLQYAADHSNELLLDPY
jgi:hypothetical protein